MRKWIPLILASLVKICCLVFFIIRLCQPAYCQQMAVKIYTPKDGLPAALIYGASQDKLGYIWVGSPQGLSRFDGKTFINYGLPDGLLDSRVGGMYIDSRSGYWATCMTGVAAFKANRFISYPLSDSQKINWVMGMIQTKKGQLWACTSSGVYQFNVNRWDKIYLYPGYENHLVRTVIETSEGLYINYGNILILQKPGGSFITIGSPQTLGYYYNQLIKSGEEILVSTPDGICKIVNERMVKVHGLLGKLRGIYTVFCDSKKRFWVGTNDSGIQLMSLKDSALVRTVYKSPVNFLVQSISEDAQGNIWIGTGNGLIKIYETGFQVADLSFMKGNTVIRNLLQKNKGSLFLNDGTLALYPLHDQMSPQHPLQLIAAGRLPNNEMIIDNYAFDDKGRSWYSLRGFVLAMQQGNKLYAQTRQLAHLGNEVFDVLFDSVRKKILVAVRTQIYPVQFNDTAYNAMPVKNNIRVLGQVMRLHQCANGTILFATDRGCIYSVDKNDILKLQLNEFNASGEVNQFYNDPSGDLWIVYNGRGLRRYKWQKDSLLFKEDLTKDDGLYTDYVGSICFDNYKNLWVCSATTVSVLSQRSSSLDGPKYVVLASFDADNLRMDAATDPRLLKDNEGNIWFFSDRNLVCFYPDIIKYNSFVPRTVIEQIDLNLTKTNWAAFADSLTGIFQLPYQPSLSHENNTLGFHFKGISSSGTAGIKYSYFLSGLDQSWSHPSATDFVSFVNLPPGKYELKVKAQLWNTTWSEPAVFSFQIKKAFWQTGWFIVLCILAIGATIYSIYQNRINQLKNLIAIRSKISRDLHDEVGSALTSIHILSKVSKSYLDKNITKSGELLQKITDQSETMQQSISDIIWSVKPVNDKIESLVIRMREYLGQTAEPKNINVQFLPDANILEDSIKMQQRQHVFLIFKEAVNNAVKYSLAKNINVFFVKDHQQFKLTIVDDGMGFEPKKNTSGNGLNNMNERSKALRGNLLIQSSTGKGTLVQLIWETT